MRISKADKERDAQSLREEIQFLRENLKVLKAENALLKREEALMHAKWEEERQAKKRKIIKCKLP
mgnify:CR=1 FL=1